MEATEFSPEHLAAEGVMGVVQPGKEQLADIEFGWPLLNEIVELDVGNAMAVRERDVIAVEAAESTEAMIKRVGKLCRAKGWVLLKNAGDARAGQPGPPTISLETIELVAADGGGCIAVGAGRVLLQDKPAVIEAANRLKVALVGV